MFDKIYIFIYTYQCFNIYTKKMEKQNLTDKMLTFLEAKTKNKRLKRWNYFFSMLGVQGLWGIIVRAFWVATMFLGFPVLLTIVISILIGLLINLWSIFLVILRCNDAWINPAKYVYINIALTIVTFAVWIFWILVTEIRNIWSIINFPVAIISFIVYIIILFIPSHEMSFFTMWRWAKGQSVQ
jgi:hypothetical protein